MDRDNPWIALPKVWIRALRGQSMDCAALARSIDCTTTHASSVRAKEEEREQGDQSREGKVNLVAYLSAGDPHFKFWVNYLGFRLIRLPSSWTEERIVFTAKKALWSLDCTLLM